MSIRARLAATYAIGLGVVLVAAGLIAWWQVGIALRTSLEATLQTRSAGVLLSLENTGQSGLQESNGAAPNVWVVLMTPAGAIVDKSADAPAGVSPVAGVQTLGGHDFLVDTTTASSGTLVVTGASLAGVAATQATVAGTLIGAGLVLGFASVIGVWLLARRALRPIDRLIAAADAIGPNDLAARLAPPAHLDEVGRLTLTLNRMLERIGAAVERQRLFVALASHELRTPLAALRTELELADRDGASVEDYRAAIRDAGADAIRLTALSTSLLELAASDVDRAALARTPVSLADVVAGVVRGLDALARARGAEIVTSVAEATVSIDRIRIEQAMTNLVTNAIVHGDRAGTVDVRAWVAEGPSGSVLAVEVLDRGPGLGGQTAAELFEPFRRGGSSRHPGAGLGLATVAAAVEAHGGRYGAEDRPDGGARFWFAIPLGRDRGTEPAQRPEAPGAPVSRGGGAPGSGPRAGSGTST